MDNPTTGTGYVKLVAIITNQAHNAKAIRNTSDYRISKMLQLGTCFFEKSRIMGK